jgi:hypothetical protein
MSSSVSMWASVRLALVALASAAAVGVTTNAPAMAVTGRTPAAVKVPAEHSLAGVSCVSGINCMAVGQRVTTADRDLNFADSWNGAHWQAGRQPASPGKLDSLSAVSCTTRSACMAVGSYLAGVKKGEKKSGRLVTLADSWNGRSWTQLATLNPSKTANLLAGVSCVSARSCAVVGDYGNSQAEDQFLAEHWNGSRWQPMKTTGVTPTVIWDSVSCPAAGSCVAVSYSPSMGSSPQLYTRVWNGAIWRIVTAPAPPNTYAALASVSCARPGSCVAVGNYLTAAGAPRTLAEAWNGTSWRVLAALTPPGTRAGAGLHGIWCLQSGSCIAVGGADAALIGERWNGHAWHYTTPPRQPGKNVSSNLSGIACWQARGCMAVGDYFGASQIVYPLAESWNGTSWQLALGG